MTGGNAKCSVYGMTWWGKKLSPIVKLQSVYSWASLPEPLFSYEICKIFFFTALYFYFNVATHSNMINLSALFHSKCKTFSCYMEAILVFVSP